MDFHLRFAMHRDIQLMHEESSLYHGFVVPAHILAYQSVSTSVFVTSLPDKPYIVDPMTFIYQRSSGHHFNEDGTLRPSVRKLSDEYAPGLASVLEELLGGGQLNAKQLRKFKDMPGNIATFQKTKVKNSSRLSAANKYLARYAVSDYTEPRTLVAPYFRFENHNDPWYVLTKDWADEVQKSFSDDDVTAVLLCPIESFEGEALEKICSDFEGFGRVLLWFDDFDQSGVELRSILEARRVVKRLCASGMTVEMLYGGFLSMMMQCDGLSAFSHGILYTQHKGVYTTPGSGGAPERYYIPAFRDFRSISQTDLLLHRHPELICNCDVCVQHLAGNADNIALYDDNPELLRRHFLSVRRREMQELEKSRIEDVAEGLRATYKKYHSIISKLPNPDAFVSRTRMQGLAYLNRWADAFQED